MIASLQVHASGISSSSQISYTSGINSMESEIKLFEVKTRPFLSKFANICSHPECGEPFYAGETLIVGAQKWTNWEFKSRPNGSLYWICAKHSSSTLPRQEPKQVSEKCDNDQEGLPKLMIEPASLEDEKDEE